MSSRKQPGFVLSELMLTMGIGTLLLTIVWPQRSGGTQQSGGPQPLGSLVESNERAAIATLRTIASAQARLASSGAIDTDDDGIGEYGFFGELAGTALLRIYDPVQDSPGLDADGPVLSRPLLPPVFGDTYWDSRAEAVVLLNGYVFKMFLPDVPTWQEIGGIAEDGPRGVGGSSGALLPWPDTCEQLWCCYAWPLEDQVTGQRVFFINQEGRILESTNDGSGPDYEGLIALPDFDAAYSETHEFPYVFLGMGAPLGYKPRRANDGNDWSLLGK